MTVGIALSYVKVFVSIGCIRLHPIMATVSVCVHVRYGVLEYAAVGCACVSCDGMAWHVCCATVTCKVYVWFFCLPPIQTHLSL